LQKVEIFKIDNGLTSMHDEEEKEVIIDNEHGCCISSLSDDKIKLQKVESSKGDGEKTS